MMNEFGINKRFFLIIFISLSFLGCKEDDEVIEVIANFTFSLEEDTGTVTFFNASEGASIFQWDFGDGSTSTEPNPVKNYDTGTFTVTLISSNAMGVSKTFQDQITIVLLAEPVLPITFDDITVNSEAISLGGANFEIIENPDLSGTNENTSNVGAITINGTVLEGILFSLGESLDLTTDKTVEISFWADNPTTVTLRITDSGELEEVTTVDHMGNGWEQLLFTYNSENAFTTLSFFVATAGVFYIDNITQIATPENNGCSDTLIAAIALPLDFEGCETFLETLNFGNGITSQLVANPFQIGINPSNFVLQIDKPAGSEFFAGVQNIFENNLDLNETDTFKTKIYSTKPNVVFRFELLANPNDGSIGNPPPVFITITEPNLWVEVEFTFINLPASPTSYRQLVIKPDNNETDSPITESGTYFIDDIDLVESNNSGGANNGFNSGLLINGGFESGAAPWTGNGVNVVANGTTNVNSAIVTTAGVPSSVNLSQIVEIVQGTNYILSFDAFSDQNRSILAGIGLNENPFTARTATLDLATETQRFMLQLAANDFGGLDSRVLFDMGAEVGTVFIDNVSLVPGGDGSDTNGATTEASDGCTDTLVAATKLPLNFEGCETFPENLNFGNGITSELVTNPFQMGINTSDFVLQINKPTGSEFFAGIQNIFQNNFDLRLSSTFTTKVYSTKPNVVFRFELLANPNDGSIGNPVPVFVTIPNANEWTEVEFTFDNLPASPTAYRQLVIKPDNNQTDSPITTDGVYYIDDLILMN